MGLLAVKKPPPMRAWNISGNPLNF